MSLKSLDILLRLCCKQLVLKEINFSLGDNLKQCVIYLFDSSKISKKSLVEILIRDVD